MSEKINYRAKAVCYPLDLLEKEIELYFEESELLDITSDGRKIMKPKTLEGLCVRLKISITTLENYAKKEGYKELIEKTKERCASSMIDFSLIGKYNPTIAIFLLKNNHGYKDKQEVESNAINTIKIERSMVSNKKELKSE